MSISSNVKLLYFPLRGRGELIRIILYAGEVNFVDEIIEFKQWEKKKNSTPFGSLPVLIWDGEVYAQSMTIARFVARKVGLAGDDDEEMARADMIAEQVTDAFTKRSDIRKTKKADKRKMMIEKFLTLFLPAFLRTTENMLESRGGNYITGNKLSYGDLALFMFWDSFGDAKEMSASGFEDGQNHLGNLMSVFSIALQAASKGQEDAKYSGVSQEETALFVLALTYSLKHINTLVKS